MNGVVRRWKRPHSASVGGRTDRWRHEMQQPLRSPRYRPTEQRKAFTLLELLVTLAIVLILVSLVLPAVQRAREAARSARCLANLRQIGVALHSYYSTHQIWPCGWVLENPFEATDNGWGWLAMLLPQMDGRQLYNGLNFDRPVWSEANRTVRERLFEGFICPSDRYVGPVPLVALRSRFGAAGATRSDEFTGDEELVTMYRMGPSSYVGVFGPRDPDDVAYQPVSEGTFFLNSAVGAQHLFDGTSATVIVGERASFRLPGTWAGMDPRDIEGPERVVGFGAHSPSDPYADEAEFSSRHPGRVHFLFGDGGARAISITIDEPVMRALTTRAGGELVNVHF